MLTEFYSFPKPDPSFNLFFLEPGEFLISSAHSSLRSSDFEFSEGKLHLCTRSLIFQPQFFKSSLIKVKLSSPELIYSFKFPSVSTAYSPNSKPRKSLGERSPSPLTKFDSPSVLTISIPRCTLISRYPPTPGISHQLSENLEFRMNQNDLLKLSTELDMVGRSGEEKQVAQIIFGVRYKELVNMLLNTDDFNPDEILLNHKCKRILPEGEQWGAFVLTQSSIHFYALMNSKPKDPLHINFVDINICTKYKYQAKFNGLRVDLYSSLHPLLFILETEEQREGIYKFMQNKIKFKNPLENLVEYMDQWAYGKLTNFEYLNVLNNLANRTSVDFSQYPIFPWVLTKYQSQVDLQDSSSYRDLSKHIGELESSRLERLKILQEERGESLFSSFYSNPSIIYYFFIRALPELLVRNQNQVFFNAERLFTSIEKAWISGVKTTGDYKELTPDFYSNSSFLINLKEMQAIGDETLQDIELPTWAESAEEFVCTMREALESDFVSQNLHKWVDIIFGYKQRNDNTPYPLFPDTCYGVNWGTLKVNLEREAYEVVCREFGQMPEQLFFTPHPLRIFRKNPALNKQPEPIDEGEMLEKYLNTLQEAHQQRINNMLEQYYKAKNKLKSNHELELGKFNEKILKLKNLIQKATQKNKEDFKFVEERSGNLHSQNSLEMIKTGKTPNLIIRAPEIEGKIFNDHEFSKTRIEAAKKMRKLQSKTPTKLF